MVMLFVFGVIVIAYFTNPKEGDFTAYIQPKISQLPSAPIIQYKNKLIYSNVEITYFNTISQEGKFVAAAAKENYIGLMGRFWKLNN